MDIPEGVDEEGNSAVGFDWRGRKRLQGRAPLLARRRPPTTRATSSPAHRKAAEY